MAWFLDLEEGNGHLLPGLIAPRDVLRGIWVYRIRIGIVEGYIELKLVDLR